MEGQQLDGGDRDSAREHESDRPEKGCGEHFIAVFDAQRLQPNQEGAWRGNMLEDFLERYAAAAGSGNFCADIFDI